MIWVLRVLAVLIALALVQFCFVEYKHYEPKDADNRIKTLTIAFAEVMLLLQFSVGCK